MSLILDALNRADQERDDQNQALCLHPSPLPSTPQHYPVRRWMIEAVLIILAAGAGVYFYSHYSTNEPPVVTETTEPGQPGSAHPIKKPRVAVDAPEQTKQPIPAKATASPVTQTVPEKKAIDKLYQQALDSENLPSSAPAKKLSKPATTPTAATTVKPDDNGLSIFQQMPLLEQLPEHFRQTVPRIEYSVHVYSDKAGAGFVTLNGKARRIGDEVAPGLVVVKILKDSVVLSYKNRQFRLLSLNSWVNFNQAFIELPARYSRRIHRA